MRRSLVVGNWKMNGTLASAEMLAKGIIAGLGASDADISPVKAPEDLSAIFCEPNANAVPLTNSLTLGK